jgi:superfamily I DNA and/or RNA helicase
MHPQIADFPNKSFYDGKLDVVPLPHQQEKSKDARVTFIAVEKPQHSASDKVNENEAKVIAKVVYDTYVSNKDNFDTQKTVGVIVPYRNQITAVRHAIDSYGVKILHDITIDTVERYQGSQRDTIIYGFTVQYPYQLTFLTANTFTDAITGALIDRKLNVALTRARKNEVIVGNPDVLKHNAIFRQLIEKYS